MVKLPTVADMQHQLQMLNRNVRADSAYEEAHGIAVTVHAWPDGAWRVDYGPRPHNPGPRGVYVAHARIPACDREGRERLLSPKVASRIVSRLERSAARAIAKIKRTYGIDV